MAAARSASVVLLDVMGVLLAFRMCWWSGNLEKKGEKKEKKREKEEKKEREEREGKDSNFKYSARI